MEDGRDGELYTPALGIGRSGCYKKYLVDKINQNWQLIGSGGLRECECITLKR